MMKKKGQRVTMWGERFFTLRVLRGEGPCLLYYLKQGSGQDSVVFQEPKGYFKLESSCKVTAIRMDATKKKTLHVFRIVWPMGADEGEGAATGAKLKGSKSRGGASVGDDKTSGAASNGKMAVTVGSAMVNFN